MTDHTILEASAVAEARSGGSVICGHTAGEFTCYLKPGHAGLHEEGFRLRDGISRTNWGDDGLAPHATKDPRANRHDR